ncbi:hypothetical protein HCW_03140 [Helicobacter cetorum MIT 00-7128]|uniref:Uncharacterized protein n=1 Tax=Helicobacter cetorum (strain ATCC BAA-429 / MIT 00-7128) TaxID=182217 RepID=I0ELU0_HELC0|nr:hypothetical protein HCW_03140 [Helicobacter cetorum MIT 00-7128]
MFYYQRLIRVLPLLNKSNHLLTHKIAFYIISKVKTKSQIQVLVIKVLRMVGGKKHCASKMYREMPPIFTIAQS